MFKLNTGYSVLCLSIGTISSIRRTYAVSFRHNKGTGTVNGTFTYALRQIFPNCATRSTKCSAKHLQVLRKETGKKNETNVTRSENCEFVRP